jgi:CheY-like chemotaxis protein
MSVDPVQGQGEKRRHKRNLIILPVEINGKPGSQAIDLSTDGMYIHTQARFDRLSIVDLRFKLEEIPVHVKAEVRYAHPAVGIGIRFLNLETENAVRIKEYLSKITEIRKTRTAAHRKQILIIEDTEFYQRVYQHRFLQAGFSVWVAKNGIEGLKMVAQNRPDLIILDLVMEGMDGYKVLHILKGDEGLKEIPVVVLSAKGGTQEVEKAIAMGAADFLVKATTNPHQVIEKIKQIFQSPRK